MGFDVVRNRRVVRRDSDRRFRSATNFFKFSPAILQMQLLPRWIFVILVGNSLLSIALLLLLARSFLAPSAPAASATSLGAPAPNLANGLSNNSTELGERHQLTYQQWVDQLRQEAKVAATQKPKRLTILAGDSISLWFPQELLSSERNWLNQGISGETSSGLLKRLNLFDETEPETIFVMVGINDLINEANDKTLLDNQEKIVRDLKNVHPKAQIVMQSILPHLGEKATWEGRDRLLAIPAGRIAEVNQKLEEIAQQEGIYYLDLYSLFADAQGNLRPELTTDGLHLSQQGYQIWSVALQVYSREVLEPDLQDEN